MVKLEPRIINTDQVDKDTKYEPPLMIAWGVDQFTTGTKTITMGRTIIPPGGRNQRHYHANCDAAFFVRKGAIKVFIGEGEKRIHRPGEPHRLFPRWRNSRSIEHEQHRNSRADFHLWELLE